MLSAQTGKKAISSIVSPPRRRRRPNEPSKVVERLFKKPPDPPSFQAKEKVTTTAIPSSLVRTLALATRFIRIDRLLEPLLTLARLGTGTERHLCRRFRSSRSPQPNALDCVCVGRNVSLYRVEAGGEKTRGTRGRRDSKRESRVRGRCASYVRARRRIARGVTIAFPPKASRLVL